MCGHKWSIITSQAQHFTITDMDLMVFTEHYRSLIHGLQRTGMPILWIAKPSLLHTLPYLLYDTFIVITSVYSSWCYCYTILQGGLTIEELCVLGTGAPVFICGLFETMYHALYHKQMKKMTESIDSLVNLLLKSGLGNKESYQLLYQKDARNMSVLTENTIIICAVCPFVYCLNVLVTDLLAGNYRSRLPIPIRSPFDHKQPGIYELISFVIVFSLVISCCKKGVNDCLFLALFKILTSSLFYLSTAMEDLKEDLQERRNEHGRRKLIRWIGLHQDMLRISEQLIAMFSPIVIIYYLNVIAIVVCGFFTLTTKGIDDVLQAIGVGIYVLLTTIHLLLLSDTAEDLSTKAQRIVFVAYDMPWFEMKKTDTDMIRMTMTISNKNINVTAYRAPIFLLNRQTFAGFIMNSISAFITLVQIQRRYG